jgi:hypothetical protein
MSMTQSLATTTLMSCSTTITVLADQPLQLRRELFHVRGVQPGGRPIEHIKRVPPRWARCSSVASSTRCASPPESSVAGCPSRM